ncbi:MAG: sensor histidine kinase [Pleomorphochaeta sp.]
MLNKIQDLIKNIRYRNKLLIVFLLFALVPLMFISHTMRKHYEAQLIDDTFNSTYAIVVANNQLIESLLGTVETTSQLMLDDESYFDIFKEIDNYKVSDYLKNNKIIENEIAKQFVTQSEVFEQYFYINDWLLGASNQDINSTASAFKNTNWEKLAHDKKGLPTWVTGYDYGQTIKSQYLVEKDDYDYKYLFTMLREMNFQYSYSGSYYSLPDDVVPPILVVHIKENSIRNIYKDSLPYENSLYAISNSDNKIISSNNINFKIGDMVPTFLINLDNESGFKQINYNGIEYLLCYDTISNKGFLSFSLVPMDGILSHSIEETRHLTSIIFWILICTAIFLAIKFSSTITEPIHKLVLASQRVAKGDFSANTPIPNGKELKILTENFNSMEEKISKLIYENYEITLKEKEAQLSMLSMQINPHFLYNTLNTINSFALKNDDEETSELIISLSEMLQYSLKQITEKALISDEINWLSNYLYIMSVRFNSRFKTNIDIADNLIDSRIPKFILQPLVENSIIHGFKDIESDGLLEIIISQFEDAFKIVIKDNGKGMTQEEINDYLSDNNDGNHLGLSNVMKRLKLYYKNNYKINIQSAVNEGTIITLIIPNEK